MVYAIIPTYPVTSRLFFSCSICNDGIPQYTQGNIFFLTPYLVFLAPALFFDPWPCFFDPWPCCWAVAVFLWALDCLTGPWIRVWMDGDGKSQAGSMPLWAPLAGRSRRAASWARAIAKPRSTCLGDGLGRASAASLLFLLWLLLLLSLSLSLFWVVACQVWVVVDVAADGCGGGAGVCWGGLV